MKFMNLKKDQLDNFFKVVDKCKGNVYLISPDMNINLKSKLAQYVSIANLFTADDDVIKEIEIMATEKEDVEILFRFMWNG